MKVDWNKVQSVVVGIWQKKAPQRTILFAFFAGLLSKGIQAVKTKFGAMNGAGVTNGKTKGKFPLGTVILVVILVILGKFIFGLFSEAGIAEEGGYDTGAPLKGLGIVLAAILGIAALVSGAKSLTGKTVSWKRVSWWILGILVAITAVIVLFWLGGKSPAPNGTAVATTTFSFEGMLRDHMMMVVALTGLVVIGVFGWFSRKKKGFAVGVAAVFLFLAFLWKAFWGYVPEEWQVKGNQLLATDPIATLLFFLLLIVLAAWWAMREKECDSGEEAPRRMRIFTPGYITFTSVIVRLIVIALVAFMVAVHAMARPHGAEAYFTGLVYIPVWGTLAVWSAVFLVSVWTSYYGMETNDTLDSAVALASLMAVLSVVCLAWHTAAEYHSVKGLQDAGFAEWAKWTWGQIQLVPSSDRGKWFIGFYGVFASPLARWVAVGVPVGVGLLIATSKIRWLSVPLILTPIIVLWPQL